MQNTSSLSPDTPLEHFKLVEDVIAHIRAKLPAEDGAESWKVVCEDVLHCELSAVEPLLLQELIAAQGHPEEQQTVRGLLRAVSWYRYPPKDVTTQLADLVTLRSAYMDQADQSRLNEIEQALREQYQGDQALKAADAVDVLFLHADAPSQKEPLREMRDQLYYQLLYPHWFEAAKRRAATPAG